jgi:hypothetical protein
VLKRAPAAEEALITQSIRAAIDVLPTLIEHGGERAKTKLHTVAEATGGAADSGGTGEAD